MLEKENTKIETSDEKNSLDEIFHSKLKKSLKVCATLDENYPVTLEENNLEDELKKTLHIYSSLPAEEKHLEFEKELKGLIHHKLEAIKKQPIVFEPSIRIPKTETSVSKDLEREKIKNLSIEQETQVHKKETLFETLKRPQIKPLPTDRLKQHREEDEVFSRDN